MTRTTVSLRDLQHDDNLAEPYMTLLDGKPYKLEQPSICDDTLVGSAGGVRSSIRDMLKWGAAFFDAQNPNPVKPPNIVPHILSEVFSAISIVKPDPTDEQLYGMGWYCQQLPSRLGSWSENLLIAPGTVHVMPTCSYTHGHEHYHVFSHGGLVAGFTTSLYILPNPGTAVVVLSNSNAWETQLTILRMFCSRVSCNRVRASTSFRRRRRLQNIGGGGSQHILGTLGTKTGGRIQRYHSHWMNISASTN